MNRVEVFAVTVWAQWPGYDEFLSERERNVVAVAPSDDIARAAAIAQTPYATTAQIDVEGTAFLRTGPCDPYAECENPAAARARDRFLGSRTAEIMEDQGVGAVIAYRRALAELEEAP